MIAAVLALHVVYAVLAALTRRASRSPAHVGRSELLLTPTEMQAAAAPIMNASVPVTAPTRVATDVAMMPVAQTHEKAQPVEMNHIEKLKGLKGLLDDGVLTQEEFAAQKRAILIAMQRDEHLVDSSV